MERYRPTPMTEPEGSVPPPMLDPNLFPVEPAEFSLTDKQRKAIRDGRGHGEPELPLYDEDKGWGLYGYCETPKNCEYLEVNHIQNQADGGTDDDPRNLISIPKCIHVGVCPGGKILKKYSK